MAHTPKVGEKGEMLGEILCEQCGRKHLAVFEVPSALFLKYLNEEELDKIEQEGN